MKYFIEFASSWYSLCFFSSVPFFVLVLFEGTTERNVALSGRVISITYQIREPIKNL